MIRYNNNNNKLIIIIIIRFIIIRCIRFYQSFLSMK